MRLFAFIAALLMAASPAFAGKRIDEYVSGYWTTYAFQDDNGQFDHCGMETRFDDGMMLGILLSDNGVNIVFIQDSWRLKPGGNAALEIKIDRRYDQFTSMTYADSNIMVAGLGFDPTFWSAFKAGATMYLATSTGMSWTVNLKGSNKATQALTVCYDLYAPNGRKGMFK